MSWNPMQPSGWIKVGERTPPTLDDDEHQLLLCENGVVYPGYYDKGRFYYAVTELEIEHVTHWMLFPPSPNDKRQKQPLPLIEVYKLEFEDPFGVIVTFKEGASCEAMKASNLKILRGSGGWASDLRSAVRGALQARLDLELDRQGS